MASFSRSFKPHSYLSPIRRPNMPGRSMSNSSLHSEDGERTSSEHTSPAQSPKVRPNHFGSHMSEPKPYTGLSVTTRPPPIDIPIIKKANSAPTPTEPLSARGDLPGGYFPLHENPDRRITRTHPFHSKAPVHQQHPKKPTSRKPKNSKNRKAPSTISNSGPASTAPAPTAPAPTAPVATAPVPSIPVSTAPAATEPALTAPAAIGPVTTASMNFTHTPVTTYYPTGHPDQSLPMGKYYPSNWENREHTRSGQSTASRSSTPKSPSQKGSNSPKLSPSESEVRRLCQLQQYKRDMVTQIALATNDTIFHPPPHKGRGITVTGAGLPTISGGEVRFGASATPYRPASPRLLPLHSPGPVTPMELGSSSGGDYIQSAPVPKDSSGSSPRTA